jgi:adenylate kinase
MSSFKLLKNVTLLGAPGSGKGFYGKLLAQKWNAAIISTSDVLRANPTLDLDSGKLIDCQEVSDLLLSYLLKQQQGYILDGYPRTLQQIELMRNDWPEDRQIEAAIHLNIPDEVCKQKSLGRRICHICKGFPNEADVQYGWFDLPPTRPEDCGDRCDPDQDWSKRKDDTPGIIQERLAIHRQHEDPIIDYYRSKNALLEVIPFNGLKDVPILAETCEEWLSLPKTLGEEDGP